MIRTFTSSLSFNFSFIDQVLAVLVPFTLRIPLLPASRILKNCIITKLTYRSLNKHCITIILAPLPQSATSFTPAERDIWNVNLLNECEDFDWHLSALAININRRTPLQMHTNYLYWSRSLSQLVLCLYVGQWALNGPL